MSTGHQIAAHALPHADCEDIWRAASAVLETLGVVLGGAVMGAPFVILLIGLLLF